MTNHPFPRIKIRLEGVMLNAFLAISAEFEECKKLENLDYIPNRAEIKNFKFNDDDLNCVYAGILRALNGSRYPTKSGKEYLALVAVQELIESEYEKQRGYKFTYNKRMPSDAPLTTRGARR